ncbi:MAG: N-acetylmuramoyl-L-alanine amidase [Bacteroidota bacterium]
MLQKLVDFFKNLFSGLFGSKDKKAPEIKVTENFPELDLEEPQDGSEIRPDTAVVVVNETEPILVDQGNDDLTNEPPPSETGSNGNTETPSTEDPGQSAPTEEPSEGPIETPIEVTTEPTEVKPAHKARYLWCLDNGHGQLTKGKRSPKLPNGDQLLEYRFNRDIVKRIIKALDEIGVQYFNVVPEVDTDNFLEGRVKRANKKSAELPKLFVSIHANAAPAPHGKWSNPKVSGIETWYFHNSSRGRKMAAIFQKHLIDATGWKNRHIKSRPTKQFYVLRNTSMTAVLTENGFYNNLEECKLLLKEEIRQKIADAHVKAILEIEKKGL